MERDVLVSYTIGLSHGDKVAGSKFTHFAQWLHVECLLFVAGIKGSKLLLIICLLSSARERASGSAPRVFAPPTRQHFLPLFISTAVGRVTGALARKGVGIFQSNHQP